MPTILTNKYAIKHQSTKDMILDQVTRTVDKATQYSKSSDVWVIIKAEVAL